MMRGLLRAGLVVGLAVLACLGWWRTGPDYSSARTNLKGKRGVTTDIPRSRFGFASPAAHIHGRVSAGPRPVASARVRLKGDAACVLTDESGRFQLDAPPRDGHTVTAAKDGYLIAGVPASAGPLEIRLTPLPAADCGDYQWVGPAPSSAAGGACGNCHQPIYEEWRSDGHAQSAVSRRFQDTLDVLAQDYPEGVAVCWSCHAPSLEPDRVTFDLRRMSGVVAAGVHCDFCHKIREANFEHAGVTHGRFGYDLLRPADGQLFFGPLDDVNRGEDAYSPLMSESRFCAACHEGTLFGVHVYGTWSEWLASPARRQGCQCQTCHMAPSGVLTNVAPASGGIERDPQTLASHTFLPGGREAMLRRALDVSADIDRRPSSVEVSVRLDARDVGHRLPTGFIDRQLLLVVEALDAEGQAARLLIGRRLPAAAGKELSGKAGRLFAKLLTDADGESPAPFWRAGVSMSDTRLSPEEPLDCDFSFPADAALVRVRLIYRRSWQDPADGETVVYDRSFPCRAT